MYVVGVCMQQCLSLLTAWNLAAVRRCSRKPHGSRRGSTFLQHLCTIVVVAGGKFTQPTIYWRITRLSVVIALCQERKLLDALLCTRDARHCGYAASAAVAINLTHYHVTDNGSDGPKTEFIGTAVSI